MITQKVSAGKKGYDSVKGNFQYDPIDKQGYARVPQLQKSRNQVQPNSRNQFQKFNLKRSKKKVNEKPRRITMNENKDEPGNLGKVKTK